MKQFIKYISVLPVITLLLISCDKHPSLQKYYVESHENVSFIALDIPVSIIKLKSNEVSDDVKETLKTIRKVNFLGYQLKDDNKVDYDAEKLKIKEILKNPKYQDLVRMNYGSKTLDVKFLGTGDTIDEIIFYGSDKELGFALVRVLGDNMDPTKMMALANEIQVDNDNVSFNQIESFLKNMN